MPTSYSFPSKLIRSGGARKICKFSAFFLLAASCNVGAVHAQDSSFSRERIHIVGSSAVRPFMVEVGERYKTNPVFKVPSISSAGTNTGIVDFCSGIGAATPDIVSASRRMERAEFNACSRNGVTDIIEIKIGYGGIVLANSLRGPSLSIAKKEIFLALAKEVPNASGDLVANPYTHWNQINSSLPTSQIKFFGPPKSSATRDELARLSFESGVKSFPKLRRLKNQDKRRYKELISSFRQDGAYVKTDGNHQQAVQMLTREISTFGAVAFSFLDQNSTRIQAAQVEGVAPSFSTIADGSYPLSRALYVYAKKAHVGNVAGLHEFLKELTSRKSIGEEGYLTYIGLVPLVTGNRQRQAETVSKLEILSSL